MRINLKFIVLLLLLLFNLSVVVVVVHATKKTNVNKKKVDNEVAVVSDTIPLAFVSTIDGALHAINMDTTKVIWTYISEKPLLTATEGEEGRPFIPDPSDGSLYRFQNGEMTKLSFTIPQLVATSPFKSNDGYVFVGHKNTKLIAIDSKTGMLQKEYGITLNKDKCGSDPTHQTVFVGVTEYVVSIQNTTGAKKWHVTYVDFWSRRSVNEIPEVASDVKFVTSNSNYVMAFSKNSGRLKWLLPFETSVVGMYLYYNDEMIRIGFDRISAVDTDEKAQELSIKDHEGTLFCLSFENDAGAVGLRPDIFKQVIGTIPMDKKDGSLQKLPPSNCKRGAIDYPLCLLGHYQINKNQVSRPIPQPLPPPSTTGEVKNPPLQTGFTKPTFLPKTDSSNGSYDYYSDFYHYITFAASLFGAGTGTAVVLLLGYYFTFAKQQQPPQALPPTQWQVAVENKSNIEEVNEHENNHNENSENNERNNNNKRRRKKKKKEEDGKIGKIQIDYDSVLGKGSHGTMVFKGDLEGRPIAVKRLLLEFYDVANHEISLLQHSDHHKNVVRYFCKEEDSQFMYIALELCLGSLVDVVEKTVKISLTHQQILKDILSGLKHLHQLNVVHRDLKPHNVLVNRRTDGKETIVITDFGLCKKLNEGQSSFATQLSGTQGWIAPETVFGHRMTRAVDIFSTGCVMYYILSEGEHPYGPAYAREFNLRKGHVDLNKIRNNVEAVSLISKMISINAKHRPTTDQIVKHPFFWSAATKLQFLNDVSDVLETEKSEEESKLLRHLQKNANSVFAGNWKKKLDEELLIDLKRHRSYQEWRLRDLLRCIRNKKHHYAELSPKLQGILGQLPDEYSCYFTSRFPKLIMHVYDFVWANGLNTEARFEKYL